VWAFNWITTSAVCGGLVCTSHISCAQAAMKAQLWSKLLRHRKTGIYKPSRPVVALLGHQSTEPWISKFHVLMSKSISNFHYIIIQQYMQYATGICPTLVGNGWQWSVLTTTLIK